MNTQDRTKEGLIKQLQHDCKSVAESRAPEAKFQVMKAHEEVLIVDDDSDICQLLSRWFVAEGDRITRAESAEMALNLLAGKKCDLVVSDVRMPRMSGIDLLKAV